MRPPWKLLGLAGLAGVAATGVVVARRRGRDQRDYEPDELRDRLHARLAASREGAAPGEPEVRQGGSGAAPSGPAA